MRLISPFLILTITLGGCVRQASDPDSGPILQQQSWMSGLLVTAEDLIVAPNQQWVVDLDRGTWGFAASSTLAVSIQTRLANDLVVTFDIIVGAPEDLQCSWDGHPVDRSWTTVSPDALRVRIPAGELVPGTHAMTLVRTDPAGIAGDAHAFQFGGIRGNLGGPDVALDPKKIHRYHHIASFLLNGVTGSYTTERLGGVLFVGAGKRRLPLSKSPIGELRFTVQNSAHGPARFNLSNGPNRVTVQLDSHEKHELSIPLDPASDRVELEVEGPPNGLYLWGAPRVFGGAEPDHPTIVLVTLDTTRRDAVAPYSTDPELTPHLARLASHATVYTRAASTSPWTLPSHASMFTGWYPSRHLAGVTDQELAAHNTTVAELVSATGVMTAGFAGGVFCGSRFGLSQGFSIYHDPEDFEVRGDDLTDLVLHVLDRSAATHPFLFVNYFDPHFTFRAPDRFRRLTGADLLSDEIPDGSTWNAILEGDGTAWTQANIDDIEFPESALAAIEAEYRAEVAFMDQQIGRLFQALRHHGLYESSLIVVVSDHGELLGEHRVLGHGGRLDPELVEVPLIVKFPFQREPAAIDDLVSLVDVFPTLLHWLGISAPQTDGRLLPTPDRPMVPHRGFTFSEEHAMGIHELMGRLRIADNLYAIEHRDSREVVWVAGHECFQFSDGTWTTTQCPSGNPMEFIEEHLAPPHLLAGHKASGLDAAELEKLRALGYVQ